ncbi:uncharacterized protein LOC110979884 isoform X2 [Acanthaster planci]|uniref:Uncharacterized protein LOC110979884 isoform X2 n=1 Tax=Acanthaster planci TaxID=133434 RepID=A0A8B7YEP8_ACAPL|nr:uncharacterized protein LOC110979884 isoform X2 [Acanthaster planci]
MLIGHFGSGVNLGTGTDNNVSTLRDTTGTFTCSLPSLSGGGQIKYQSKPRQQQKSTGTQEPLVSLPSHHGNHKKANNNDSRYVTRSVPVHSARHKKDEDRGSSSAPNEVNRHHTNHDRQQRVPMPRLPKINNLLSEPLKQQVHGTSTATEAGRKEIQGGKRWASSWADARANSSSIKETSRNAADNSHQPSSDTIRIAKDSNKIHSPNKSSSPRIPNGSPIKFPKDHEDKFTIKENGEKKAGAQKMKHKNIPLASSKDEPVNLKESKLKSERRTQSSSQIETKTPKYLPNRSKSSAVLTNNREVTRQNSHIPSAYSSSKASSERRDIPQVRVWTTSRGSQSTSTTLTSKPPATQKKRFRKPVIITRKSLVKQKTLQSVYGNKTYKLQRQVRVLQKMEQVQKKEVEDYNRELKEKEKQKMDSVVRQRMALKRVRDKFDEDQVRRFRRQYVSWKSVEEDRLHRSSEVYGLPDFIYEDRYEKTLKETSTVTKKAPKKFQKYATWVRNIKVFEKLLNPTVGGNLEEVFKTNTKTIVEGIDTVKLDNDDSSRPKKVNVKRLIGSAKKLLTVTETMDDISEVSSHQEDDLSDDSLDLSEDEDQ